MLAEEQVEYIGIILVSLFFLFLTGCLADNHDLDFVCTILDEGYKEIYEFILCHRDTKCFT